MSGSSLIDLSHAIVDGMQTYPGLPGPIVCDFLTREASLGHYQGLAEFAITRVDLVGNTGTYIDSPFHRFATGIDIAELPLERLAGVPGIVVRARGTEERAIGPGAFLGLPLAGRAVLVETGWSDRWGTPTYFEGHPFLTEAAAGFLREQAVALVGIDSLNIDDIGDLARPVHTTLLGSDIPIVEHLRGLDRMPDRGFRFFAVPAPVSACGTFPVRAFAEVDRGANAGATT